MSQVLRIELRLSTCTCMVSEVTKPHSILDSELRYKTVWDFSLNSTATYSVLIGFEHS